MSSFMANAAEGEAGVGYNSNSLGRCFLEILPQTADSL